MQPLCPLSTRGGRCLKTTRTFPFHSIPAEKTSKTSFHLRSNIRSLVGGELGVDDVVGRPRPRARARARARVRAGGGAAVAALVHRLAHRHHLLLQRLLLGLHALQVVRLNRRAQISELRVHLLLDILGDLVAELCHLLLRLVAHGVRGVLGVHGVALRGVLRRERLGILHHLLNLILGQSRRAGDLDVGNLARALVRRRDGEDAVRVDVELHLDLRHAARRGGNAVQAEVAQGLVVLHKLALALKHVDLHRRLAIRRGRENLRLGGGQRGVAHDELGHDAAQGLQAEGQRRDVQKHDVGHLTAENARLNGGAQRHNLVGVHGHVGLLAGELLDKRAHGGDARGAADEDHLVHVGELELGVAQRVLHGHLAARDEVVAQLLELRLGEAGVDVLGAVGGGGDERERDGRGRRGGELHLRLLRRLGEALQRLLVLHQVDTLGGLEVLRQPLDDALVEVVAAQEGVAGGGEHLEHAVADFEDGHVEGPAAEVEDQDRLVRLLLETVRQGSRGGLVDDAQNFDAGDLTGILSGLALRVVEVRGHGDHRFGHGVAEVRSGVVAELAQHLRGDLLRGEVLAGSLALELHVAGVALLRRVRHLAVLVRDLLEAAADEALHGEERVLGVHHALALGDLADEAVAVLGVGDDGGGGAAALGVGHDGGGTTLHGGDRGVGGAEVDADDLLGDDAQRHGLRGAAAHGGARLERLGVAGEAVDADRFLAEASHGSAADARRGGRDGLGAEDTVSVHRVWGETGALRWGVWRREGRVT
mmetsp:Transcript_7468/g.31055  ORF Transcript_7468/g.31055 Transcript_7468/m.31055 type:complete len:765 (+) Transcript_7468:164-2458(+)